MASAAVAQPELWQDRELLLPESIDDGVLQFSGV
jgi:hypothetical protein